MLGSWSDFDSWVQSKSIVQPPTNHDLLQCLNAAEKFWSKTLPWKMSVATVMNKAMKLFGSNVRCHRIIFSYIHTSFLLISI